MRKTQNSGNGDSTANRPSHQPARKTGLWQNSRCGAKDGSGCGFFRSKSVDLCVSSHDPGTLVCARDIAGEFQPFYKIGGRLKIMSQWLEHVGSETCIWFQRTCRVSNNREC